MGQSEPFDEHENEKADQANKAAARTALAILGGVTLPAPL